MVEAIEAVPSTRVASIGDRVITNDWHVVAQADELLPGTVRPIRLMGQELVLWRSQDGQLCLWDDCCPHRSVRLSNGRVEANTLICPYHGMAYNPDGQCIHVPAHPDYTPPSQARVPGYRVQERYGLVFVCLGETPGELPTFPEWEDAAYVKVFSGPHPCHTGGYRAIENFLDVAHFPFLHAHILGDPAVTALADYQVSVDDRGVHFHNVQVWQPDPIGTGEGAYVTYAYSALRPLTAYLRKDTPQGDCLTIMLWVTPVEEEECISWMWMGLNFIEPGQEAEAQAFQAKIVAQDVGNLESHRPKQLPLNPQAEFHVPCDRGSLAYRKWLKQLGVTYGVIP